MQHRLLPRQDLVLLTAILLSAGFLRFFQLGHESLWLDEGVSVGIARLPWEDFFKLMWRREGNMTLYYLLLRVWMMFGSSEAWVRALSTIFSVLTVPFVYLVGKELRSRTTGLVAALLFALSPFSIAYAREARSYSLLCLLLTAASWFLLRKQWNWWAVTIAIAVYAHLLAVLVLGVHVLYLALSRYPLRNLRGTLAKIALASLPAVAFVLLKSGGQLDWIPPLSASRIMDAFGELAGGGDLALIMLFLVIIVGMLTWRVPVRSDPALFVWLWLLIPPAAILLASLVHPLLVPRFLILSLPALMIVAAIALTDVHKAVSMLLLVVIMFFSVRTEVLAWRTPLKDDWRSATAYVLSRSSRQDGIVFHQALGRQAFEYYAARAHATNVPRVISPARATRLTYRDFEGDPEERLAAKLAIAPPVLWVMLNRKQRKDKADEYTEFLLAKVKVRYTQCVEAAFRGIVAIRCAR